MAVLHDLEIRVKNLKKILGIVVVTCRGMGFPPPSLLSIRVEMTSSYSGERPGWVKHHLLTSLALLLSLPFVHTGHTLPVVLVPPVFLTRLSCRWDCARWCFVAVVLFDKHLTSAS